MKLHKLKIHKYFWFDLHILDIVKYEKYQHLLEKQPKGKYFKLPNNNITKTNEFNNNKYHIMMWTTTLSFHTIYFKKIVGNLTPTYIPSELINRSKSNEFIFRTLLCFDNKDDAEQELLFLCDFFNKKHNIIIIGSFEKILSTLK